MEYYVVFVNYYEEIECIFFELYIFMFKDRKKWINYIYRIVFEFIVY